MQIGILLLNIRNTCRTSNLIVTIITANKTEGLKVRKLLDSESDPQIRKSKSSYFENEL